MESLKTSPITTWQFYLACKRHLGITVLNKIYSGVRSKKCHHCGQSITADRTRQINSWSADPRYAASNQPNPLDRIMDLLDRLMDIGKEDVARAAVDMQAKVVGCFLRELSDSADKQTISEELLDNIPAFSAYTEAARQSRRESARVRMIDTPLNAEKSPVARALVVAPMTTCRRRPSSRRQSTASCFVGCPHQRRCSRRCCRSCH